VPRSFSQRATAAIGSEVNARAGTHERAGPAPQGGRRTSIFIVASPRPQVGKTFIARLLIDFLRLQGGVPMAFDLNPDGDALRDYLPTLTLAAEVDDTPGQMALFDRMILNDGTPKVVDVGAASFDRFFKVVQDIRFIKGAERRSIDAIILFVADLHPVAIKAYADLQRRFPGALLVPVLNDAIVKDRTLRDKFPFTRTATVPLQITALSPTLKAQIERSGCSFADVHDDMPLKIPLALAYELRAWTRRTFVEFRELELRLLLEQLRASMENPLVGE
jgi:hypothetical protein